MRISSHPFVAAALAACATAGPAATKPTVPEQYSTREVALPGATPDGIFMDYLAFDPRTGFVWAPAGNTGAVDVVDTASGKVSQIAGFPTSEMERRGRKRTVGPSSAAVGDGVVYVGNRGDSSVCSVDAKTLARGACGHLDSMPDGLAYVAATGEVWVTTPRDQSIRILDAKSLATKAKLTFEGEPEGFAVDAKRGRFYTNLEDKDRTLAIDLKTHATVATWAPSCGEEGPHGLALDEDAGWLFIACSTRSEVMNVGGDGAILSQIDTGDGVDNLDYSPKWHELYVGAAGAAKLTVARVEEGGKLTVVAQVPTKEGARNGVVTNDGDVYLAASAASELVVAARAR
jgi:DNA-binding beta-propeller fold protein YncE